MQIQVSGQQLDVTPALREYVAEKFGRIARPFEKTFDARVVLGIDKLKHRAEATVKVAQRVIHAEADAVDMYAAIDVLSDKLDGQLRKHKEKVTDHRKADAQKAHKPV
jgi:putative sigma-54 modulation protein